MYLVKNYKSPFYQIVCFIDGKRTTISTKTGNYREATRFINNFTSESKEEIQTKKASISLSKFQNEYVDYIKPTKSISYVRSIKLSFKMLIAFTGDLPLNKLELLTIDKFITHTFARTPRGASLYYRTLKAAFSKAVLWNYIPENPLKKIKSPKVAKTFHVFISETELQMILEKTKADYLKTFFYVAFYTGMRLGELVNMKWSWIDMEQNQITVKCSEQFTTKSKKERVVPMNQSLVNLIMKRFPKVFSITNDDYVFTRVGGIRLMKGFTSILCVILLLLF
jgi:integrase